MLARLLAALLGCSAAVFPAHADTIPAAPDAAAADTTITRLFRIFHDGTPIGEARYVFVADGPTLTVTSETVASRRVLGLTVFRFIHRVRETWRGGRLIQLEAVTDDNGQLTRVTGHATAAGLEVDGPAGRSVAPPDAVPTTYWHPATMHGVPMIDTRAGVVGPTHAAPLAREASGQAAHVAAQGYKISGPVLFYAWYDADGVWRRTAAATEHGWIEGVGLDGGDRDRIRRLLKIQERVVPPALR
ncbi:MAG TPA: DUF6134 family protein [Alphaproteobacteria bacterium]